MRHHEKKNRLRTTGQLGTQHTYFWYNYRNQNAYRQIHKEFYCVVAKPSFRNLVSNSLFHGLKLGNCRFSSEHGEAVCPRNWVCIIQSTSHVFLISQYLLFKIVKNSRNIWNILSLFNSVEKIYKKIYIFYINWYSSSNTRIRSSELIIKSSVT